MIELNLEERRPFLKNYDKLVALFGQDLVDEGLMRYTMHQLCDVYQIPLQDADGRPAANVPDEPYIKPHLFLGKKRAYYRFTNSGGWEKSVSTPVTEWQVPAQYQHNDQAKHIIRPALLALRPWLANYRLEVYSIDFYGNRAGDFYVKTGTYYHHGGFDSLYVPYEAFLAGDVNAIIHRSKSYFDDYTKDKTVWERMSRDPVVISFLNNVRNSK